jgi:betaine-aldehyde dehydrogenase
MSTTTIGHFIAGHVEPGTGERTGPVYNPSTGEEIARCDYANRALLDRAVAVATEAGKKWGRASHAARQAVIFKLRELVIANIDLLAEVIGREHGKTIADAKGEIGRAIEGIEFAVNAPHVTKGEFASNVGGDIDVFSIREPIGVVGAITPFNFPIMVPAVMMTMAVSVGNAIVWKPSEKVPTAALIFARLWKEAGLPDGVFNVVLGDYRVGSALSEHPDIAKISFTGGVATGKKVMAQAAASSLKDVTMELGGKSPLIICADADINLAADIAMMANFYSAGQVCTNGTRVFVPAKMKEAFEAAILERVARIRIGNPLDAHTNFGPLASFPHMEKVLAYIEKGRAEGARLLAGGQRLDAHPFDEGAYVAPTVFTDCLDDMTIVREEIFGPVMSILSYTTEEEVIVRANATAYGLAAGVVTPDLKRAHRIIGQIEAGICWINSWGESPAQMPVGGYKQSGIGRENGIQTLLHYTQTKSVQVELGDFQSVF